MAITWWENKACIAAVMVITVACPALAAAQAPRYPTRPVRMIVPLPPGGSTDIVARIVAQKYTETWGQQVVVDNRPGAGTSLGSELAARATPDGYTLLFASGSLATNVPLYPKLPYHPIKDFMPIGIVGQSFYVLLVQPSLGVNSVQELITMAKAKPNYIQYASAGQGTITHMAVELFMMNAQIKMQDVPYKGGAPALLAFLSDQMPVIFSPIAECLPHLRAGAKVRPLAVTAAKRVPDLPDVPTLAEAGVPDSVVLSRTGILAPAGTPRDIVNLLNAELNRLLQQAYVRDRLNSYGLVPVGGTPEDLGNHLKSEIARWTKVVKAAGIKLE
ncbi:MAG: tripartite tricarboxylate transporter substrate binding protein [Pseudomonadota bacterium]